MKTKALFVYIVLGIAFAAVSLWVFFSKGKNARAIRTKYKLGGAMIAAWDSSLRRVLRANASEGAAIALLPSRQ